MEAIVKFNPVQAPYFVLINMPYLRHKGVELYRNEVYFGKLPIS